MTESLSPLARIREKLEKARGLMFWRSLDEVAETPEFQKFLQEEYPYGADFSEASTDRRKFLKLMGASLLMSGLAGCKPPSLERIVPYVKAPEEIVPGKPLFFATAMPFNGAAMGLLAESHMGRPTRVEGNPQHPDSLGATDIFAQASILGLYDPDRSKTLMNAGRIRTWDAFVGEVTSDLEKLNAAQGAGISILTEPVISPTLAWQIGRFLQKYPKAKWHQYDPAARDHERTAAEMAFGEPVDTLYNFKDADVILTFDAELFFATPGSLRNAREFTARRSVPDKTTKWNRLYSAETAPTLTGSMADHRLALSPAQVEAMAFEAARLLGATFPARKEAPLSAEQKKWIHAAIEDLKAHRGRGIVAAGNQTSAAVQALVHAMNQTLGNAGSTVKYIRPVEERPVRHMESLRELVEDLKAGTVEMLVILGANPVYTAPADFNFASHYLKAGRRIHSALYQDETSVLSHWHVPASHYLEMFSDARASDGTVSLVQPLIEPLFGGKAHHEIMALLLGEHGKGSYEIVQEYWKTQWGGENFDKLWRKALHDGIVPGSAFEPKKVTAKTRYNSPEMPETRPGGNGNWEIAFRPDPSIWDGRFANNAWLQELPKFMTTLTWDNAVILSPKSAEKLGVNSEDIVEVSYRNVTVRGPVLVAPGFPENTLTLHLGYGRKHAGQVGNEIGFDAYAVRFSNASFYAAGAELKKIKGSHKLALTQHHHSMHGRELVRVATKEQFEKNPGFVHHEHHGFAGDTSMYPKYAYDSYAWGMAVNLNTCIGCNACVIACQSENNIPTVGKDQVLMGREMHWIRVDRYYAGTLDEPAMYHQPMLCMHCENAPCEPVCPVGATVHSSEGLNEMVYNRCVGTRYCSNNCPYKVRRFNFLEYTDKNVETLKMQRNPDVTVRARGVMEKCTFCVQRINHARIDAKKENRTIRAGEVVTACQSACPTQALIFGDINNPESEVTRLKATPLNYGLLTELNTVPRVSYLGKVTNPNPVLSEAPVSHGH